MLYHDNPASEPISSSEDFHRQTLIDYHRKKIAEMLEQNAKAWIAARRSAGEYMICLCPPVYPDGAKTLFSRKGGYIQ